jgi:hypothetical protein
MSDRVPQHIVSELQQGARADTIFVLIGVFLNLVMLGLSFGAPAFSFRRCTLHGRRRDRLPVVVPLAECRCVYGPDQCSTWIRLLPESAM